MSPIVQALIEGVSSHPRQLPNIHCYFPQKRTSVLSKRGDTGNRCLDSSICCYLLSGPDLVRCRVLVPLAQAVVVIKTFSPSPRGRVGITPATFWEQKQAPEKRLIKIFGDRGNKGFYALMGYERPLTHPIKQKEMPAPDLFRS